MVEITGLWIIYPVLFIGFIERTWANNLTSVGLLFFVVRAIITNYQGLMIDLLIWWIDFKEKGKIFLKSHFKAPRCFINAIFFICPIDELRVIAHRFLFFKYSWTFCLSPSCDPLISNVDLRLASTCGAPPDPTPAVLYLASSKRTSETQHHLCQCSHRQGVLHMRSFGMLNQISPWSLDTFQGACTFIIYAWVCQLVTQASEDKSLLFHPL